MDVKIRARSNDAIFRAIAALLPTKREPWKQNGSKKWAVHLKSLSGPTDFKVYYRLTLTCIIVAKHEELVIGTERGQIQAF